MSEDRPMAARLSMQNFGPIREASIETRPLTVIIGPNNSGKSVLATTVYASHLAQPLMARGAMALGGRRYFAPRSRWAPQRIDSELRDSVSHVRNRLAHEGSLHKKDIDGHLCTWLKGQVEESLTIYAYDV